MAQRKPSVGLACLALAALVMAACSVNPATGKRQINMIGEEQEIQMGKEADAQIVASMGLYDDAETQAYVSRLGKELAAHSERPNLPWTFRVVDDPTVNAFALPGGYIYITRGIMTHLTSEAELVGVLGHEIGHVTARHSVNQMSKAQLANIGLVGASIFAPEAAQSFGQLAGAGLQLAFLKFSRDDERQADELGLRYMTQNNYDPREMATVFQVLERVSSEGSDGGKLPGWMSTHPSPGNRVELVNRQIQSASLTGAKVNDEAYLEHIDGMVFGPDPREGFFRGNTFMHPELEFRFTFPNDWPAQNSKQAVAAISPKKDAIIQITLAEGRDPEAAAQKFFSQQGLQSTNTGRHSIGGIPAISGEFTATTQQGQLRGMATFLEHDGKVFQILGYSAAASYGGYDNVFERAAGSFGRLTDRAALNVKPMRVDVVRAPREMTITTFENQYPSPVSVEKLAIINHLNPNGKIESGQLVKRIVGENPAG